MHNLLKLVDPSCLKYMYDYDEYRQVRSNSTMINFTTLYMFYTTTTSTPISYQEFYNHLKNYFYYDKYICKHGTEFIYYVKAKDETFKTFLDNKKFKGYDDVLNVIPACNKKKEK